MALWTEETNWEDSYAGRFSFMRMPIAATADGADIAVMGIPLDMTTTGRPGARFGPRAIREQSLQAGEFEWGLFPWDYEVRDEFRCVDIGDVTGFTAYTDRIAPAIEKKADAVLATGASLLSLGGDHFISLPLLRAHARKHGRPLALIHFDAHSDTWASEDINHGTMFYHAVQEGVISVWCWIATPTVPLSSAGLMPLSTRPRKKAATKQRSADITKDYLLMTCPAPLSHNSTWQLQQFVILPPALSTIS